MPDGVAHRAGNSTGALHAAIDAGVDWVEADIWWQYGRLEARHEHAIWRLPIRYDQWKLGVAVRRAPRLAEICRLTLGGPRLLIDLKGSVARLPIDIVKTLRAEGAVPRAAICGQVWPLLDAVAELEPGLQIFYSLESEQQLAAMRVRPAASLPITGVSCAEALLTADRLGWMRARDLTVFAWTVNDRARALELASLGVSGIISDNYEVLEAVRERRPRSRT